MDWPKSGQRVGGRRAVGLVRTGVATFGRALADLLVPRRCIHCKSLLVDADLASLSTLSGCGSEGRLTELSSGLCGACWYRLSASEIPVGEMPYHIDAWPLAVRWVFSDASPIRSLHHAFKYEGRPELADALAAGLRPAILALAAGPGAGFGAGASNPLSDAVIIPVPSHRLRILDRGYCQAAVLAGRAARPLGCRAAPGALARRVHAGSQTRLHARQRLENVYAAFEVRNLPDGNPIIILDDVITTGATLHACATRLEEACGASRRVILLAAPAIRPPLPSGRTIQLERM